MQAILKLWLGKTWGFLKPILMVFLSQAGKLLAASALRAVKIVAESYGAKDGAEKRKAAFDLIYDDLRQQGVTLGASVINMAIEVAVQKLKDESGA